MENNRLRIIALFFCLLLTWLAVSYNLSQLTQPDQGTFMAFGYHLLQGKQLYTDFFDHKPPAIYLLNAAVLGVGGATENAISWFALGMALLQTMVFFRLAEALFKSVLTAFFSTLIFVFTFYRWELFGSGNFTEQYGALCTTAAFWFYLKSDEKARIKYLAYSAFLFGLAFAFKEPFLFSAVPFGLALFFRNDGKWMKNTSVFIFSFLTPWLLILLWMLASGTWAGYMEHLIHSLQYTEQGEPVWVKITKYYRHFFSWFSFSSSTTLWLYFFALPLAIFGFSQKRWFYLILAQQVFDFIATGLTGNGWHHYFLQSTPLMVLLMVGGAVGVQNLLQQQWKSLVQPISISPLLLAFALSTLWNTQTWKHWAWSPEKNRYDEIANYLQQVPKPVNLAVARQECGFYYVKLQAVSPLKYVVPYPFHWVIADSVAKARFLNEERLRLEKNPPEFILTGHEFAQLWIDAGMDKYAQQHYHRVSGQKLPDGTELFLLKRK